ncbi:MAG: hypothetical protein HON68_03990 [Gammaproteobacteria bacterium]|nr:hypothetical protein [Gammaproteobacteria bacterium]MBT3893752.1 hypothetical protein [Gammaproteobacteria bacterium]MBT4788274.1 hypothetical protein [Gammaproteobacteria bacterium]MBT7479640.1 hypothetical protein [Gammaproteobacteria bacterium]HIJ34088.1 hypothetical protein [Gammaproteobacteria bacterium]
MNALKDRCITFILITEAAGYDAKEVLRELFIKDQCKLEVLKAAIVELDNASDGVITL